MDDPNFYTFTRPATLVADAPGSQIVFPIGPLPPVTQERPRSAGASAVFPFGVVPVAGGDGAAALSDAYFIDFDEALYGVTWSGTLASSTKIWAKVTIADLEATDFEIETGTDWPDSRVELDEDFAQIALYVRIGYVEVLDPDAIPKPGFNFLLGGDTYHFVQLLNAHQQLVNGCWNGTPAVLSRGGA